MSLVNIVNIRLTLSQKELFNGLSFQVERVTAWVL
jgi:hypothetical protein